ncbi:hypothetical protein AVEN_8189-1 [Araneus ventricosus]|uniref:Integrase catalytic domain-containing protein n=1 Tax=Araneus ventricosus TaxID=182803 RepID=A0A4Y2VGC2_ARAVE|nr:hypothetical protein AVEN_8189-1 [Araneus ventricosus]
MFFLLVDSFSKWLEVKRLSSATSSATIRVMREIFAAHGIPDSVASDNGSQYTSEEFQNFLSSNRIRHILVAQYHKSSIGQAERVVQATKDALKRIISGPTGIPGTVIEKTCPLSYKNVIPDETQENSTTPMSSSAMQPRSNTPIQSSDPSAEIETPEKAPDESYQSRPQQTINRPSYLKDYVM